MDKRKAILIGLVLLLPVAISVAYVAIPILSEPEDPADLLKGLGYYEIVPASRFHGPGTYNTVEVLSDGRLKLHPTCEMGEAVLQKWWRTSPAGNRDRFSLLTSGFDITSKILDKLSTRAVAEGVKSITIAFKNMEIILMSHEALSAVQLQFLNGNCQKAIEHNLKAGAFVCQTHSVLEADLVYKIEYDKNIDDALKGTIDESIEAFLNISAKRSGKDEITGENLFYGVRLSNQCIASVGVGKPVYHPLAEAARKAP